MKWLSAGLTYVAFSTASALLLGAVLGGLGSSTSLISLTIGVIAAMLAFYGCNDERTPDTTINPPSYRLVVFWIVAACFAIFALRSFCWLVFSDGNQIKVQSPNNLGDLALHIAYIKGFASGVALWPDNPIFIEGKLRYPAGVDLFNALLSCLHFDLFRTLVWTGLLASVATCFALYRWGGPFGIAGFLFNGGLAGFQVLQNGKFLDYQGDKTIAWKSIPLAMFVTQRGLLYAIPAGLLLLCHWRSLFASRVTKDDASVRASKRLLPFWLEVSLYATMPLFHVHTFLALSLVLAVFIVTADWVARKRIVLLLGSSLVPASLLVWTITDHFHASSILKWNPGWVQHSGDFAAPFLHFWLLNFGFTLPLAILLLGVCLWQSYNQSKPAEPRFGLSLSFTAAAAAIFVLAVLVKTAPWEWDNTKLILWAYIIMLPFLWSELVNRWPLPVRAAVVFALFGSGFVSLLGGLGAGKTGFNIADRAETDAVAMVVRKLPVANRFASFPTYNHPLLLAGRKVALGYPGHLWTQGFDYSKQMEQLTSLMKGAGDWKATARALTTRYLFWGPNEKTNYPGSTRPWEREARLVGSGPWGAIYDLESPSSDRPR